MRKLWVPIRNLDSLDATIQFGVTLRGLTLVLLLLATSAIQAGAFIVPSGSSVNLGSGTLSLNCNDLSVAGTFRAGKGTLVVRSATIEPSGTFLGQSGYMRLMGDWSPHGVFQADSSTVLLTDGCGTSQSAIHGENMYSSLLIKSSQGKVFQFDSNTIQKVQVRFSVEGVSGNPVVISRSGAGPVVFELSGEKEIEFADISLVDIQGGVETTNYQGLPVWLIYAASKK